MGFYEVGYISGKERWREQVCKEWVCNPWTDLFSSFGNCSLLRSFRCGRSTRSLNIGTFDSLGLSGGACSALAGGHGGHEYDNSGRDEKEWRFGGLEGKRGMGR